MFIIALFPARMSPAQCAHVEMLLSIMSPADADAASLGSRAVAGPMAAAWQGTPSAELGQDR